MKKFSSRTDNVVITCCIVSLVAVNWGFVGWESIAYATCTQEKCDEVDSLYVQDAGGTPVLRTVFSGPNAANNVTRAASQLGGNQKLHATEKIKAWLNCDLVHPQCASPVNLKYYQGNLTAWDGEGNPPASSYGTPCTADGEKARGYCSDPNDPNAGVDGSWL